MKMVKDLNFLSGLLQCETEPAAWKQRSETTDLRMYKLTGFRERVWALQEIELRV